MYQRSMLGMAYAAMALALTERTPDEREASRKAAEDARAQREAEEAARHPATKRKERSASLERMLGKRKPKY